MSDEPSQKHHGRGKNKQSLAKAVESQAKAK